RRDMDDPRAIAARAAEIDQSFATRPHGDRVRAHSLNEPGDLIDLRSPGAEDREEGADLRMRRRAREHLAHGGPAVLGRERPTRDEASKHAGELPLAHERASLFGSIAELDGNAARSISPHPTRKFARSDLPIDVRIDSGWNWTPYVGWFRCSTAMTIPSGVRAVTSTSRGT